MHFAGHPKTLDMFTYLDSDINDLIFSCMTQTSLTGVSGRVVFSTGADPDRLVKVERIQDGARKRIALYRQDKDPKYFEWIEGALIWKGGMIPRDSAYIVYEELKVPVSLSALMLTFAALGIILSIFFLVFNIVYRNNSYVKMSSSNINNVLLLGCMLCYCTVFFKTIAPNDIICKARVLSFSLGFTITFGALFSKTWRVYRIFTNRKLLKLSIKDRQLYAIIIGLVVVVLVVVIIWELVGPHEKEIKILTKEMYTTTDGTEVQPLVNVCDSSYSEIFGWTLYIIEGALLTFGAFLAWETRNVRIKALNDSYRIGLCLYNVVILSAVGLTLSLLLEEEVLIYGITSGCLIIGTTVTQMVIFLPKIQAVWHRVEGQDMSTSDRIGTRAFTTCATTSFANNELKSIDENIKKFPEQNPSHEAIHKRTGSMPAESST
ncbi:gamma-aminobutyric acid type B receptor subunit 2-like [Mercenaria mercenaria]|uniref:gamma-aminobutyric acid type B receptor subunit 2-like n=1 Tax=Mercenaria mercenaria TaxID=6596 RepID=UPI00234E55AC|nr:gamma-aminobutyric acid type B receptor subunit 2-like [Mercenaria mercenaria]